MLCKTEFLFNILMVSEIPFIRINGRTEFLLLDHRVRIATFCASDKLLFQMSKYKYKDLVYKNGKMTGKELANILDLKWISKYKEIII